MTQKQINVYDHQNQIIKVHLFEQDQLEKSRAYLLLEQARSHFNIVMMIRPSPNYYSVSIMNVALISIHLMIECYLKSILAFSNLPSTLERKHDLTFFVKKAKTVHPELNELLKNEKTKSILQELSKKFHNIRYFEGCVCLSNVHEFFAIINSIQHKLESIVTIEHEKLKNSKNLRELNLK